ncbi:MAG: transferase [Verrucomicrobiota bacterium]
MRLTLPLIPSDCDLRIPGGGNVWQDCEFVVNPPADDPCDFWIVCAYAQEHEMAVVAPQNTLFINGEPLEKKKYPLGFYAQFGHVVDTHNQSNHPNLELHASCLGWGVNGRYNYFAELLRPSKINRVGVICSSTAQTSGQKLRLKFLAQLKASLGGDLVHFGRGFKPIENKLDGILPYRFQLVLENCVSDHYWTEKLADAYLGWGFPLYAGCLNLESYFDPNAFRRVDLNKPRQAIELIRSLLATPEGSQEIEAVRFARGQILKDYHMIFRCAALARRHYVQSPKNQVAIRSYKYFRKRAWPARILRSLLVRPAISAIKK